MSDYRSQSRDGFRDSGRDGGRGGSSNHNDDPPMSRLFIICNKAHTEEDFREAFSRFGEIEDIWVVKDKHTQENKGIAYIKFAKTSDAANAQEEMNGKTIGNTGRTLKVLVAANRDQGSNKSENEHEKYLRLFVVLPKNATEEAIREDFEAFGEVESVTIVKEKGTGNPKGFGYIRFSKFSHAALAFENCSVKYKAVFAEPKGSMRTQRDQYGRSGDEMQSSKGRNSNGSDRGYGDGFNNNWGNSFNSLSALFQMQNVPVQQTTSLEVVASNCVNQDQLWRLFNIIPGLENCQIIGEHSPRTNEVIVVYDNPEAAIYAKKKLHGLEYPMGERLIVKVSGMNTARMDTSFIGERTKKDSICNVPLPPAQPLASADEHVEQRLFIVLAANLPQSILKNVFCCWRGLIDVYLLPNKNCGYVKYADSSSAHNAIETLNGAEICGTKIKVMEAEERGNSGEDDGARKRLRRN